MNKALEKNNEAVLIGKIVGQVNHNYVVEDEKFYEFKLEVDRLSDTSDVIPVTISEGLAVANNLNLCEGETFAGLGEFRSYNKLVDGKSKLMLHFFTQDILSPERSQEFIDKGMSNNVRLSGFICKPPVYRTTPFNREICDVLIAVNRNNGNKGYGKSDYIPCIAWGRNARCVREQAIGTKIEIFGRIQSRNYNKTLANGDIESRTAYEVSCQKVEIDQNLEYIV